MTKEEMFDLYEPFKMTFDENGKPILDPGETTPNLADPDSVNLGILPLAESI